jgi:hypothetical protein
MRGAPEQLEFGQPRRGGLRRGAGRKPSPNPLVRHRSREKFTRGLPCLVTLKVREDVPSLRSVKLVREVEKSFAAGCERGEFRLVHYSLQGNHAHLVVEAADRDALGRGMKALGARLARAVNRVFSRTGRVLADRYHVRVLRGPREVRNALRYVLLNARRHAAQAGRRLQRAMAPDPASSGRWFDGWRLGDRAGGRAPETFGLALEVPGSGAVARPHSWLLRVGWLRRGGGRIDPDDVPGT